jgi:hypothetical protein
MHDMSAPFILYVDFDNTLFDTKRFAADLYTLIARHANTTAAGVAESAKQHISHPGLGGYQFARHIAGYNLDSGSMWQQLGELLATKDYLYPDSSDFIQQALRHGYDPHILSFGETRFQQAKIRPALTALNGEQPQNIPMTIIDYKKHIYINRTHPGGRGTLIDDVPDQQLPAGFTEIHIDRSLSLPKPLRATAGYTVSNLSQALQVIDQLA